MEQSVPHVITLFAVLVAAQSAPIGEPVSYNSANNFFGRKLDAIANNSAIQLYDIYKGVYGQVRENSTMRVLELMGILMPSFTSSLSGSGYNFIEDQQNNPFNFKVANFTIDLANLEFAMGTAPIAQVDLIPGYLRVTEVTTEVRVYAEKDPVSGTMHFGLNGFGLAATWWIGNIGFDFKLSKIGGSIYFYGAPKTGTVAIGKLFTTLGESILPDGAIKSALQSSGLDKFSLEKTRFRARYNKLEGFAMSLSGRPTIADWSGFDMTVMYHRYQKVPWREGLPTNVVSMSIIFDSFRLSRLVQTLTGLDITGVPLLGTLVMPRIGVVIASGEVAPNLIPEVIDDPLLWDMQPFSKGVTLATRFSLKPELNPIRVLIRAGPNDLSFNIIDYEASLTVRNLIEAILPDYDLSTLPLPPGVSDILDLAINEFGYDHKLKCIVTRLTLAKSFTLIPNVLTISKPFLRINITLSKPRKQSVEAGGRWLVGKSQVPVSVDPTNPIARLPTGPEGPPRPVKGYMVSAEDTEWRLGEVLQQFGASFLPDEFSAILSPLADFKILRPKVQIPVGLPGGEFLMFLAGQPEIAGWKDMILNAVIIKKGGKTSMATGFEFVKVDFAWLVKKVTGFDVSALKLLSQSLRCGFVLAKENAEDVALIGDLLKHVPIRRGISIVAAFSFPPSCTDQFCVFAKKALGTNAQLRLSATVSSLKEIHLYAVAGNINLGPSLTLTEAGLEFILGPEPSFGITATLKLNNPPISFRGAVRLGAQGLELSMTMIGIWKRAFSIAYLAFGNAHIATAFRPDIGITLLQVGAEVRVGKLDSGKELIGIAHVGIDATYPRRNYFYGKINKASIQAIMEAFEFSINIPRVLSESGFPRGLETSFAFDTVQLPTGLVIPMGFKLNGTLNILGYELTCDIALTPPSAMRIYAEMDPLDLAAGQIILVKSISDKSRGPFLNASITLLPTPKVTVQAYGYVKLFGLLNRGAMLEITDQEFTIAVYGKLFLFDFQIRVSATYGSLQSAAFRVYAEMASGGMAQIADRVKKIIDAAAKEATSKINDAQSKVDSAQGAYDDAVQTLRAKQKDVDKLQGAYDAALRDLEKKKSDVNGLQKKYDAAINDLKSKERSVDSAQKAYDAAISSLEDKKKAVNSAQAAYDAAIRTLESKKAAVNSAQRKYDDAVNSLRSKQNDVNNLCSIKSCSSWNAPYPCGVKICHKSVWSARIPYPCGVNTCYKRVTDPVCITANTACEGVRAAAFGALEVAKQVVDKNRWPLDAAKGALTAAQKIVDENRWPLDAAKGALTAAQKVVDKNRWPLDAAKGALIAAQKIVDKNRWPLDVAKKALDAAQKIVDKNRWPLDAAKGILTAAEVVVDNNRWPLDAAKGVLEGVKIAVKAGAAAAKFITSAGLGGLIDIKKMTFDVKIGLVSSGHVAGSITVSFLKKSPTTFGFNIRMNSLESMAKDLAEMAFDALQSFVGRRRRRSITVNFHRPRVFFERFVNFSNSNPLIIEDDTALVCPTSRVRYDNSSFDFKLREINKEAETVETKCKRYRNLSAVLRIVPETITAVSSGVQQTIKDYLLTKGDLAKTIVEDSGKNINLFDDDDVCTAATASLLSSNEVPVAVGFNSSSLRRIMHSNFDAIDVLEEALNQSLLAAEGLTSRQYLTKLVWSLLSPYEEEASRNPKAEQVAKILQRISNNVETIFEGSLYDAWEASERILKDLDDIEEVTVFCVRSEDEESKYSEPVSFWDMDMK